VIKNISRRHPTLAEKDNIYNLILESYRGGESYKNSKNLFQYYRETEKEYRFRLSRSVLINHLQPCADTLSGLLFIKKPERNNIDKNLEYLITNCGYGTSLDSFMMNLSIFSNLFTCGILIDMPVFDETKIKTKADFNQLNINPFVTMYLPTKIRDFDFDSNGILNWVLLDNSCYESSNPFAERTKKKIYRLWTREFYQDFIMNDEEKTLASDQVFHGLGEVPFIFVNWKNSGKDRLEETAFEDVALLNREIYNLTSEFTSAFTSSCIRALFYPVMEGDNPDDLIKKGFSSMTLVTYNGNSGKRPEFDSPSNTDSILVYDKLYQTNRDAILNKFGLDRETEKAFATSGISKNLSYQVTKSYLSLGAENLEMAEKEIFRFSSLWLGSQFTGDIKYNVDFTETDINSSINLLLSAFDSVPFVSMKKEIARRLTGALIPDTEQKTVNEIYQEIENYEEPVSNINKILSVNKDEQQAI
jgi:hypothetical protein